ncbi:MAG: AAA family ATPase, partial [Deltaproteobacteria bacterium]|nr:AAA family ATPase [Deltaproteobacteria bacterium]
MRCTSCECENPEDAAFCSSCGSRVALICHSCGRSNTLESSFCNKCGQRLSDEAEPTHADAKAPTSTSALEAERRQLTVMFCDLVGSMELSELLDAEALSEVVSAYQKTCAASVESFDGHIAQYLGDGVLVYFGYPLAHEDDAMRAIHAALRIVEEVPGLNSRLVDEHAGLREHPLQIRVGIHTGSVVVGAIGGDEKRERLALGDTVNIAARLEGEAEPGSIVVSDATRHLVRGAFVLKELGERSLKGIEGPVALFRPLQATGVQSRLALTGASGLTPLVGREQEVGLLLERWEEAKAGHGQVVLLSGEAGMGKSRLIEVLREHVADEPHTWHEYRGSAYHQNSAFYPVVEFIERVLLFTENDTPEERVGKLARGISYSGFPTEQILPLIADFLGLPLSENLPTLALSPEEQRKRTMGTLCLWSLALAQRQPLIMIGDDLHGFDPSSLEVGGMTIEQVPAAPILFVATFRPEFEPPWPSSSRLMHLPLQPLTQKQVETMARHLAGGKPLPIKVREQIAAKTDGVPLFVEELTKSVLESSLVVESDERYERSDPLPDLAIPSTLRDSLTARLDRLGPAKEVAQLAAVLGREFSHDLLQVVLPLEAGSLDRALGELVGAGLLYQRGIPPHATYIFKHALIQEAAHQSLLKKRRRDFNALVAKALEEHFPERVESEPEVIARHYEEGGLADEAIAYYARAGEQAAAGCAHAEAIGHLHKSIALLGDLPANADRDRRELRLLNLLGTSLIAAEGYSSPSVQETFSRAQSLCEVIRDPDELASSLWGLSTFRATTGSLTTADELAERLADLTDHGGQPICRVGGRSLRATAAYYLGRFPA